MPGAGQLNSRIHLLKPTETTDASTGEVTREFTKFHTRVPAKREDVSGGHTRRGEQVEESVKTQFIIPFIEDVSPQWRVQLVTKHDDGPTLEIINVLERDDRRQWLSVQCGDVK